MSDMIDRVARAMCGKESLELLWHGDRMYWVEKATQAISAMREPTVAMYSAGCDSDHSVEGPPAVDVWHAMIDEALK